MVPAIAVADALRADGAEVSFIGGARAEAQLVPAQGFVLNAIAVEGLSRSNPLRALRALALAALALPRSLALLRRLRPDAVMGGGGYVAGPVGVAAVLLRIPLVLTEADSHLGLTNRLLAPFARRVCLAFAIPGRDGDRFRVTGRPIAHFKQDRAAARAQFGLAPQETCVLVFGGSLGARSINIAAAGAFAAQPDAIAPDVRVLHISGQRDHPELLARELPGGYDLRDYLSLEEFAQALAAADLVVARSGGSVFELAAHGLPAILIPYPHAAADHQTANARWMADAGAALVIADEELSAERLRDQVRVLLSDRERLAEMAAASASLARPDAARDVAAELLEASS